MNVSSYLSVAEFLPKLFKINPLPDYLVFFVTHRCVANCGHCFDWERRLKIKKEDELNLEEIEKISKSMGKILFMFFTGGEPFLREDLSKIAKIFYKNNRVLKFQIPSNGWFTDRVVKQLKEIAIACPNAHVSTTISIDGIGKEHDKIRGLDGLFEKAARTIKEVQKLCESHSNIGVNVEITVSKNNEKNLVKIFKYLTEELKAKNVFFPVVRGNPRDHSCKEVDISQYDELSRSIHENILVDADKGFSDFPFARVVNWKNMIQPKIVSDIKKNNHYVISCVAGRKYGILYANGDVSPCEMISRPMGNVRDYNYDFKKLWLSKKNRQMVKKEIIKKRCFCTHECAISASLLLTPKHLGKIILNGVVSDIMGKIKKRP